MNSQLILKICRMGVDQLHYDVESNCRWHPFPGMDSLGATYFLLMFIGRTWSHFTRVNKNIVLAVANLDEFDISPLISFSNDRHMDQPIMTACLKLIQKLHHGIIAVIVLPVHFGPVVLTSWERLSEDWLWDKGAFAIPPEIWEPVRYTRTTSPTLS